MLARMTTMMADDVVLTNVDEETVLLKADGSIVWLSHEGMDKGPSTLSLHSHSHFLVIASPSCFLAAHFRHAGALRRLVFSRGWFIHKLQLRKTYAKMHSLRISLFCASVSSAQQDWW